LKYVWQAVFARVFSSTYSRQIRWTRALCSLWNFFQFRIKKKRGILTYGRSWEAVSRAHTSTWSSFGKRLRPSGRRRRRPILRYPFFHLTSDPLPDRSVFWLVIMGWFRVQGNCDPRQHKHKGCTQISVSFVLVADS
jgi:hypothetical protein